MPNNRNNLTIGQILGASFNFALNELRRDNPFVNDNLNFLVREGFVTTGPLGAYVQTPDGRMHDVQEAVVPLMWSRRDDQLPERLKIDLAARLIENGVNSLDDFTLNMLKGSTGCVVSRDYNYSLGETHGEHTALYRALAVIRGPE